MMKQFVRFYSPGTLFSETREIEVAAWDTAKAIELSKDITERHGAKPYGFSFYTKVRGDNDFDSHTESESGMYYINGVIETLEDVIARNDPGDEILISNMKGNGWGRVVTTSNGYRATHPFRDVDQVVSV